MGINLFVSTFSFCLGQWRLGHIGSIHANYIKLSKFSKWSYHFVFLPAIYESYSLPTMSPTLGIARFLAFVILIGMWWYLVVVLIWCDLWEWTLHYQMSGFCRLILNSADCYFGRQNACGVARFLSVLIFKLCFGGLRIAFPLWPHLFFILKHGLSWGQWVGSRYLEVD